MSTSERCDVNRHTGRCRGLAVCTGVWLRAEETEISAALWALWLEKDFTYFTYAVNLWIIVLRAKGLPRQATDTDGRLHISQVRVEDSGQYVCTALDAAAGAEPATVTLIVDDSCMIASICLSQ